MSREYKSRQEDAGADQSVTGYYIKGGRMAHELNLKRVEMNHHYILNIYL